MLTRSRVVDIGLVSDTHFQDRLFDLPEMLTGVLRGAELILHAGDIGDLALLDYLGRIAPVVAVHGNDEPDRATRDLPDQALVGLPGGRALLWHSHYLDRAEELANRAGPWGPKLKRIAHRGLECGARVVVFGHTHVPMVCEVEGVLLVNPGALAAGSYFTRQINQTVARLLWAPQGPIEVNHFDVKMGKEVPPPEFDMDDEFAIVAARCQTWMVEPELVDRIERLRRLPYEDVRAAVWAVAPLHRRYLAGGMISRAELVDAIRSSALIAGQDAEQMLAILD